MNRVGAHLFLIVALGMAAPVLQAQQAAKIHMHADSGYAADGLLFEPTGTGPFAALLLIHDEWGLTDRVIEQARRFANAGFVVVAIDLYRGEVASDAQRAGQLNAGLAPDGALHDLKAAMAFLAVQPNVRPGSIGTIGWSAGAAAALRLAAQERPVSAVVINSCEPPTGEPTVGAHTAVLGNFGGCHHAASSTAIKHFAKELEAEGATLSTKIYAANRDLEPLDRPHLQADDAHDAESRTLKFLASTLGSQHATEPSAKP